MVSVLLVTRQEKNAKKRVLYVANAGDSRAVILYRMNDDSGLPLTNASTQQKTDATRVAMERAREHEVEDSSDRYEFR